MKIRALAFGLFFTSACGFGPEDNFIGDRDELACDSTYPICAEVAGCTANDTTYLTGKFPGDRAVIVPAPEDSFITVSIYFKTEGATGEDTFIEWNEPGCFDSYQWRSEGADIFLMAGNDRVLSQKMQVFFDGDHLVKVTSDATADYLLKVKIDAP